MAGEDGVFVISYASPIILKLAGGAGPVVGTADTVPSVATLSKVSVTSSEGATVTSPPGWTIVSAGMVVAVTADPLEKLPHASEDATPKLYVVFGFRFPTLKEGNL